MTYELAKKLKEAGFPQKEELGARYITPKGLYAYYPDNFRQEAYSPTLSELIEACGEKFGMLRSPLGQRKWTAQGDGGESLVFTEGSTPEEAVARLWLALNKK